MNMISENANVAACVESEIKQQAEAILDHSGVPISAS